jgi:hypothetical protein
MEQFKLGGVEHGGGHLSQENAVRLLLFSLLVALGHRVQQGAAAGEDGTGRGQASRALQAQARAATRELRLAEVARVVARRGSSSTSLLDLPLAAVCTCLGAPDLRSLACTSRELRDTANDEHLWAALFERRFGAVRQYLGEQECSLDINGANGVPWRLRYWSWEYTWRERVVSAHHDIWAPHPTLLVHGHFLKVEQLINEHPGGAELLGNAMGLGRDVGDLFDIAAHPPRALARLRELTVPDLEVPAQHEPLLG